LAQADADVQLFAFAEVDVADIAREVHDIFSYNAEEREQKLQIDVPAHAVITGDAQRLRQLLVILTDNAQKYAGEGVIVTLRVVQNERQTLIAVSDTGQGVSDEDKRHLFDRFYRVDKARSRSTGGHGLGLAIAKWVTDGHHGTIVVEDTIPHGTTFKIILPNKQKGIK
jgi:two-component system sensor histidine kinase CiaH